MSIIVKVKTKITHEWLLSLTSEEAKDLLTISKILVERDANTDCDKYIKRVCESIKEKFNGLDPARAQISENNGE